MKKKRHWKYKWNTVIDDKTCNECLVLNNKIFTREELDKQAPPLHRKDKDHAANCRCYLSLED